MLLGGTLFFLLLGGFFFGNISLIMSKVLSGLYNIDITYDNVFHYFNYIAILLYKIIFPLAIVLIVAGFLIEIGQTGLMFNLSSLAPKFDRMSPIKGAQRLFSKRGAMEVLKALFKISGISYILYTSIRGNLFNFSKFTEMDVENIVASFAKILFSSVFKILTFLFIIAILDYVFQKFEFEKSLKMTKQEVKDEYKQTEGDPQIKSRIRAMQRQLARQRMMQEVPKAKVVITNPTHLAIAIKYENDMKAPVVVAKGARFMAEKIKGRVNSVLTLALE